MTTWTRAADRRRAAATPRRSIVPLGYRSATALALACLAGLCMFLWPLVLTPEAGTTGHGNAPLLFVLILPVVLAVVLAELHEGGMDTKALAMLGVLSAMGAALRPMGAGVAGLETVFFLLILAGRVYGPAFGFVLGCTTMFSSAVLTGGIGPWLPFQMLASAWVGMGAGLLPMRRTRGRAELALLCAYGVVAAYAYGFVMNMWSWPFAIGADTQLSYVPGDAVWSNLHRFVLYTVATSTLGWDTGRAITNVAAIALLGGPVLFTLRRATRRAAFDAPVTFEPADR